MKQLWKFLPFVLVNTIHIWIQQSEELVLCQENEIKKLIINRAVNIVLV